MCSIGDNDDCCKGKDKEKRSCIPCDETRYKKPDGSQYVGLGNCEFKIPNRESLFSMLLILFDRKYFMTKSLVA